jgi:DNA repair exonuclease SbcCD nuclease subunit
MFKFLHAADIHLDSPQKGLDRYEGAPVEECRGATRRALENLVRLAVDERVAFVLIVGDLYDGDWPDYNTGLFFSAQMVRLRDAGIHAYLIRGNHDAANKMTRDLRPLDNVHFLASDRPQTVPLDDVDVAIHGQGFATRAVVENLAKAYPARVDGVFNIGLLHTCVEGREGHERYAPCSIDDLRFRGYDYWALGHIHKRETLHTDPVIAFPGNIQGRSVRERGPKGCLLVTVDDARNVGVETRWLDVMRWETCRVDASGAADGEELLQRFRDQMPKLLSESDDRLLALRVEVQGACRAHAGVAADWPYWTQEIRQTATEASGGRVWVEKALPRTCPPEALGDGPADGPLAELGAFLDELRRDEALLTELGRHELDDLKKKLPHDLLDGLDTAERLRELLDQVGPMLMNRLNGCGAGGDVTPSTPGA